MAANEQYVDLGLTSKTLWATCNLGASSPEEYGDFYAWGETTAKTSFTWKNYTHGGGTLSSVYDIGSSIVATSYDAAMAELGSEWCLPTSAQFEELVKECTFTKQTVNDVVCMKVTGPNGNYIILPLAGYKYDSSYDYNSQRGYYWSGNDDPNTSYKATVLSLIGSTQRAVVSVLRRRTGMPVRAVRKEKAEPAAEPYVDLGLTSKTLWATCNLGASSPEEYGDFYAWGETTTKTSFTWKNYTHCGGTQASAYDIGSSIVATSYDAAMAELGSEWCLPTSAQFDELVKECTFTKQTVNDVVCMKVTGPNGNSIFFPLSGYKYDSSYSYNSQRGYYWSGNDDSSASYRSTVLCLTGSTQKAVVSVLRRRTGMPVRAVVNNFEPTTTDPISGDPDNPGTVDHVSYIDLGLTSQTEWASCNLGATSAEDYGDFYAWGETVPKTSFTWKNYTYCGGTQSTVYNIGSSIVATDYDAVTEVMGDEWCMPTANQFAELVKECTFTKETVNDVECMRATGPNGNSIILPLAGYKYDSSYDYKSQRGYYWSGNIDTSTSYRAKVLCLTGSTQKAEVSVLRRRTGMPIRPVRKGDGNSGDPGDTVDPTPAVPGSRPGPIIVDPYFTNKGLFDTDGIDDVHSNAPVDTDIYTLSGVKVETSQLQPGIYVRNGKKFVVR